MADIHGTGPACRAWSLPRASRAGPPGASWFAAHRCAVPQAPVETFENYIHLLEAAASGDGIALGWNGFMRSYFTTGRLVPLRDEWLATGVGMYGVLTPHGLMNATARGCLSELAILGNEFADPQPMPMRESVR